MRIGVPRRAGYGQAATMAMLNRGPDAPCPLTAGDEIVTIPQPVRRGRQASTKMALSCAVSGDGETAAGGCSRRASIYYRVYRPQTPRTGVRATPWRR